MTCIEVHFEPAQSETKMAASTLLPRGSLDYLLTEEDRLHIRNSLNEDSDQSDDENPHASGSNCTKAPLYQLKPNEVVETKSITTKCHNTPIRLLMVKNNRSGLTEHVFAHCRDLATLVERKSNISRLFGRFKPRLDKIKLKVRSADNRVAGQCANLLTRRGVKRFLKLKRTQQHPDYVEWIRRNLLPEMQLC